MNKSDKLITIFFLFISCLLFLIFSLKKENGDTAIVYYQNKIIKEIDLSIDNNYEVEGELGIVKIVVKNHQIKVENENSPKRLCSKKGFISSSIDSIVCLPNKIVIQIKNNEIDTMIG